MSEDGSNGWKILSIGLIVTLVCSCFVLIGFLNFNGVSAEPNFIDVSIDGPKKLGVNENGTYTAYVESETSGNLDFTWSVSPQDNKTVLSFDGAVAKFKFVIATEEPYLLSVQVHDVERGNFGSAAYTVYDPFTSSNLYLTGSDAVFSYMVESDNLGWYRVKSGVTGAVVGSPGTNLATVTSGILTSMTSGTLFLKEVSFDLALLESIPEDVQVVESVNSRTRIFINSADSLGSPYTVSVEGSNYFAQDRDNRICWSSTNATTVIQNAIDNGNNVFLKDGVYLVSGRQPEFYSGLYGSIMLRDGVWLHGESREGTIIKHAPNTPANVIAAWGISNFTLSHLTIDGDRANQVETGIDGLQACFYQGNTSNGFTYEINALNAMHEGVYNSGSYQCNDNNIYAYNTGLSGYAFSSTWSSSATNIYVQDCDVFNNSVSGCTQSGVFLDTLLDCVVSNIYVQNSWQGFYIRGGAFSTPVTNGGIKNSFDGLYSYDNAKAGFYLSGVNASYFGMIYSDEDSTSDYGIAMSGVTNCVFDYIGVRNAKGIGVSLMDCDNNKMEYVYPLDDQSVHTTSYYFKADADCSNNTLTGGDFSKGSTVSGKYLLSPQSITFSNVVGVNNQGITVTPLAYPTNGSTVTNSNPFAIRLTVIAPGDGCKYDLYDIHGATFRSYGVSYGSMIILEPWESISLTWTTTRLTWVTYGC